MRNGKNMRTWFLKGLSASQGHSHSRLTGEVRPLACLLFIIMLVQPAWASTTYTCFEEKVSGISNGVFVNPEAKPFKINVSDDGVNFVANSFFQNLSMGAKDTSNHEQFRASFEPSAFIHFDYPYLYFGSAYPRNSFSLEAICHKF